MAVPGQVTDTTLAVEGVNQSHIFRRQSEVEDVQILYQTILLHGLRNNNQTTLNLKLNNIECLNRSIRSNLSKILIYFIFRTYLPTENNLSRRFAVLLANFGELGVIEQLDIFGLGPWTISRSQRTVARKQHVVGPAEFNQLILVQVGMAFNLYISRELSFVKI